MHQDVLCYPLSKQVTEILSFLFFGCKVIKPFLKRFPYEIEKRPRCSIQECVMRFTVAGWPKIIAFNLVK
jgi:hypothetical protein